MTFTKFGCGFAATTSALVLLCAAQPAFAKDGTDNSLTLKAEIRVRYESYDGGYRASAPESDDVLTIRTRVFAEYDAGPVRIGGEFHDARAYGDDLNTPIGTGDVNALEVPQLYIAADLSDNVTITAGRQVMNFGSRRILGEPAFRNTSNGFTGVRVDAELGGGELIAFYTLPQQRLPSSKADIVDNKVKIDREDWDYRFWGGFYSRKLGDGLSMEAFAYKLEENDEPNRATANRDLLTLGGRLMQKPATGQIDGEVEIAWQTGDKRTSKSATAPQVDVDAWMMHADLGYSFDGPAMLHAQLLFDYASGDDASTTTSERFDPLFGPRRDLNPTGLYGPIGRANLVRLGAKLSAKPFKGFDGEIEWSKLWLDSAIDAFASSKVSDASGASGKDAGSQLQGRARYWLVPKILRAELGGAILFNGDFLENAPNAAGNGDTQYVYSALTLSF